MRKLHKCLAVMALVFPVAITQAITPAQMALAKQYGVSEDQLKSAGATASPAAQPSESAPALQPTIKPRSAVGKRRHSAGVAPFGYDLFAGMPTSNTPLADLPVPDDYIIGPGDELRIQLYGKENALHSLKVSRKGQLDFPGLGPIYVAGKSYQQVAVELIDQIKKQIIGVDVFVSMGELRLMQITVTGDAFKPGAYNVNALTTLTQALQAAGGVAEKGSLRRVQVRRANQVVQEMDLYDLLLKGNNKADIRLRGGDVVHVPGKVAEATVSGLVRRPAIFELKNKATLADLIGLAGGLRPEAVNEVKLTRKTETGVQVHSLKLASAGDRAFAIKDGDVVEALQVSSEFVDGIVVKGAVIRPGTANYKPGLRVSDLLGSPEKGLKLNADLDYALLVREVQGTRNIKVLQFNLAEALKHKGGAQDLLLAKRDQLIVFANDFKDNITAQTTVPDAENKKLLAKKQRQINAEQADKKDSTTGGVIGANQAVDDSEKDETSLEELDKENAADAVLADTRNILLKPIIEQLKQQATPDEPVLIMEASGELRFPGVYPLPEGATLADLIQAAGGLREPAGEAELTRYAVQGGQLMLQYSKKSLKKNSADLCLTLQSKDKINVLTRADWLQEDPVTLKGAVARQGKTLFKAGLRVADLFPGLEKDLKPNADLSYALIVREIDANHNVQVLQFDLGQALKKRSNHNLALKKRDQIIVFANDLKDESAKTANLDKKLTEANVAKKEREIERSNAELKDKLTGANVPMDERKVNTPDTSLKELAKPDVVDVLVDNARDTLLAPVILQLKHQASLNQAIQLVEVSGEVRFPGVYPLTKNGKFSDLLVAAGGAKEQAYKVELSRYLAQGNNLQLTHNTFELSGDTQKQLDEPLQSKDRLNVLAKPEWREEVTVVLQGEVQYPGSYTVRRGETMKQVLQRAGGLTQFANPKGAIFARESLRLQEQERMKRLADQLRAEVATMSIRRQSRTMGAAVNPVDAMKVVGDLETAEALGRLVVDMPAILAGKPEVDLMLENKDKLYIPPTRNMVSIMGEVQHVSNHTYLPELSLDDYLERGGGAKKQADTNRTYVIRADGSVRMPKTGWFSRQLKPEPGDTIVVPIDTEYIDSLSVWTSVTQIMYQLGVAWAAIKP